ncbi:hypothetical protein ES703_113350 [subsurface metagenome]
MPFPYTFPFLFDPTRKLSSDAGYGLEIAARFGELMALLSYLRAYCQLETCAMGFCQLLILQKEYCQQNTFPKDYCQLETYARDSFQQNTYPKKYCQIKTYTGDL